MPRTATAFFWVGNHPGLDLVNTLAVDDRGERLELVLRWTDVVDWAETAGLIDADLADRCRWVTDRRGSEILPWFRRLRAALREVLESGDDPAGVHALDDVVAAVPVRLAYQPALGRPELAVMASAPLDELRLALASAALAATRLNRSRVRRCENAHCVLLYYDTTKNHSRRWCDMAVCGNRAKASAHYRRTSAQRRQSA
jgi:predicted RNA-binding Zn ribbon-like protein